jgi:IS66 C-terminal element
MEVLGDLDASRREDRCHFARDSPDDGFDLHVAGLQHCRDLSITAACAYRLLEKYIHNRRSWLFAETQQGARASANLYSLVRCAQVNGLEPYAYLLHLLEELPKAGTVETLEALLPWNVKPLLKAQRVGS